MLLAPGAAVVGDVRLGDDVSVWYGASCAAIWRPSPSARAPTSRTARVLHVADDGPCIVGADVVVGHRAMLHACRVEDACLIGMQATILDEAVIGAGSVVGAGRAGHPADGDPAPQPGAGRPRQGRPPLTAPRRSFTAPSPPSTSA